MKNLFYLLSFNLIVMGVAIGDEFEVDIKKYKFIPAQITIRKGDKVTWVNKEKRQYHSVWFEQRGDVEAEYFFPDESYSQQFNTSGRFPYRCGPHAEMTGVVYVKDK